MNLSFTFEQIKFLMTALDIEDPDDALDAFMRITQEERIDPNKMHTYLNKLMKKDVPK
jgi:hypothetical protein